MCTSSSSRVLARDFLHGAVEIGGSDGRWEAPQRFTKAQREILTQCRYWTSSVYVQMAQCTSGISIQLRTNATRCVLECAMDDFPSGSCAVLSDAQRAMGERYPQVVDGFSIEIDGVPYGVHVPSSDNQITIDMPSEAPESKLHTLRIFFPCLTRGRVGSIELLSESDTVQVDRVEASERPLMLVCGNSLSQGFCTFDPARTYPQILADLLGSELVNHGIGGHVFQADLLNELPMSDTRKSAPEIVIVEYGANYRYWACDENDVRRDIEQYFSRLTQLWGQARIFVFTHMPHTQTYYETDPDSCYGSVPTLISEIAGGYENVRLIDGREVVPLHSSMTADPDHLNADGNEHLARALYNIISTR